MTPGEYACLAKFSRSSAKQLTGATVDPGVGVDPELEKPDPVGSSMVGKLTDPPNLQTTVSLANEGPVRSTPPVLEEPF